MLGGFQQPLCALLSVPNHLPERCDVVALHRCCLRHSFSRASAEFCPLHLHAFLVVYRASPPLASSCSPAFYSAVLLPMEPAKAASHALSWKDIAVQKADYLCSGKGWTGPFATTESMRTSLMLPLECSLPDLTIENEDDNHLYLRLNLAGWTLLRKDGPRLHEVHGAASDSTSANARR